MNRTTRAARDAIAKLVEETGADSVCVLFTVIHRRGTTSHTFTFGNQLACSKLLENTAGEILEEEEDGETEWAGE